MSLPNAAADAEIAGAAEARAGKRRKAPSQDPDGRAKRNLAKLTNKDGWAAPAQGPITSRFGPREPIMTPEGPSSSFHRGTDLAPGCDEPIWAAQSGTVTATVAYTPDGAIDQPSSSGVDNFRPKFVGSEWDPTTALYHMGVRYYAHGRPLARTS